MTQPFYQYQPEHRQSLSIPMTLGGIRSGIQTMRNARLRDIGSYRPDRKSGLEPLRDMRRGFSAPPAVRMPSYTGPKRAAIKPAQVPVPPVAIPPNPNASAGAAGAASLPMPSLATRAAGPIGDPQAAVARMRSGILADPMYAESQARGQNISAARQGLVSSAREMQNLGTSSSPVMPGIDQNLLSKARSLVGARTRSAMTQGGLPDLPVPEREPERRMRPLGDMSPGDDNNPSRITRYTTSDGQVVVAGPNVSRNKDTGEMTVMNPDGTQGTVIMPRSGYSLGLRQMTGGGSDGQGNPVPYQTKTESSWKRMQDRLSDLAMNGDFSASQRLGLQDGYMARRDQRREDALDLRRRANAMRGYGQTGALAGYVPGPGGTMIPASQPVYGNTGPSLAQAAGMIREQDLAFSRDQYAKDRDADREAFLLQEKARSVPLGMTPGEAAEDELRGEMAGSQTELIQSDPSWNRKLKAWTAANPGMDPANVADAPAEDKVNWAKTILTDPTLEAAAKMELLRQGGFFSREDLKKLIEGGGSVWSLGTSHDPWGTGEPEVLKLWDQVASFGGQ